MADEIYKVEKQGDITIMTLTLDYITMHQNKELMDAFSGILDKGAKNIVLDLSNTAFISSIVIASLVFMHKRAKEAGGNLVICGIKEKVKEILATTNLDKVFDTFEDKQKALNQFTKK